MSSKARRRQVLKMVVWGSVVGLAIILGWVGAGGWVWPPEVLVYGGAVAALGLASGLDLLDLRRTALAVLALWLVLDGWAMVVYSRSVTASFLFSRSTWILIVLALVVWWNQRRTRRVTQN